MRIFKILISVFAFVIIPPFSSLAQLKSQAAESKSAEYYIPQGVEKRIGLNVRYSSFKKLLEVKIPTQWGSKLWIFSILFLREGRNSEHNVVLQYGSTRNIFLNTYRRPGEKNRVLWLSFYYDALWYPFHLKWIFKRMDIGMGVALEYFNFGRRWDLGGADWTSISDKSIGWGLNYAIRWRSKSSKIRFRSKIAGVFFGVFFSSDFSKIDSTIIPSGSWRNSIFKLRWNAELSSVIKKDFSIGVGYNRDFWHTGRNFFYEEDIFRIRSFYISLLYTI